MKNLNQKINVLFWTTVVIIDAALILDGGLYLAIIGTAAIAYIYYLIAPLVISFIERKAGIKFTEKISLAIVGSLTLCLAFAYIIATGNTTFKGKVIDADTKKPIIGAVVVASWLGESPGVAGTNSRGEDVKETVTDENGAWSIKGPRGKNDFLLAICSLPNFFTGTYSKIPPQFIIFKPGYCSWPQGFSIGACKDKIRPIGQQKIIDRETIELPKLTSNEDRRMSSSVSLPLDVNSNDKRIRTLIKLLNQESREIGNPEYPIPEK